MHDPASHGARVHFCACTRMDIQRIRCDFMGPRGRRAQQHAGLAWSGLFWVALRRSMPATCQENVPIRLLSPLPVFVTQSYHQVLSVIAQQILTIQLAIQVGALQMCM